MMKFLDTEVLPIYESGYKSSIWMFGDPKSVVVGMKTLDHRLGRILKVLSDPDPARENGPVLIPEIARDVGDLKYFDQAFAEPHHFWDITAKLLHHNELDRLLFSPSAWDMLVSCTYLGQNCNKAW
jgi:hypothetical protein